MLLLRFLASSLVEWLGSSSCESHWRARAADRDHILRSGLSWLFPGLQTAFDPLRRLQTCLQYLARAALPARKRDVSWICIENLAGGAKVVFLSRLGLERVIQI